MADTVFSKNDVGIIAFFVSFLCVCSGISIWFFGYWCGLQQSPPPRRYNKPRAPVAQRLVEDDSDSGPDEVVVHQTAIKCLDPDSAT